MRYDAAAEIAYAVEHTANMVLIGIIVLAVAWVIVTIIKKR
jgi:hypothetical protein